MKMIVIADDFTGSNDTGVQLAKKGARTEVMLSASQKPSRRADVLVINTESRRCPQIRRHLPFMPRFPRGVRHRQRRWCTKKSTLHFAAISEPK